jgi:hypothetical protein
MSNLLFNDEVYELNGKKTGREIADILNRGLSSLAKNGKEKLDAMYGVKDGKIDKKSLTDTMRKEARKANQPMSIIETLKTSDGEFYQAPDAMPNRKWFESRFISVATREIIDRKLPGGQFVQVSNLGFREIKAEYTLESEDQRVTWLKEDTTDIPFVHKKDGVLQGVLQSMGAVVSISLFQHTIPNYESKTFEEKVAFIKENNLDILGYRIPTQGQNSTVVLRVVGLLPEQSGDSIILPSEFTGLTGSDFDIDKLFLVRKNMTFNSRDQLKVLNFITNNDDLAYNRMLWHKFAIYRNRLSQDFIDSYYNKNYERIENSEILKFAYGDLLEERNILVDKANSIKELRDAETNSDIINDYNLQLNDIYSQLDELKKDKAELFALRELEDAEKGELTKMIGRELVKQGFVLPFKKFKALNDFDKNIPAAIENHLFDAYRAVLTSDAHLLSTTSPLGGLTDQLKDMAQIVRDAYKQTDTSMLALFTPKQQSETKFKYANGKAGIGPFALHNSHHVLTQIADYAIRGGISSLQLRKLVKSKLSDTEIQALDLSGIFGSDEVKILDWLSALIDAHVDLAKDPYIMDLNINPFTYDIAGYLIRTGVGIQAFKYLAMEGISLASEKYLSTRVSIFNRRATSTNKVISDMIEELMRLGNISDLKTVQDQLDDKVNNFLTGKDDAIENNLFSGKELVKNRDYWLDQIAALQYLKKIKEEATILTQDVQSTQIDSRKYGTTLMDIEAFMSKIIQSYENSEAGLTFGYEKLVPYDPVDLYTPEKEDETFIASYYREGLAHILELFSDITINSTKTFRDSIYEILKLNGRPNPTKDDLKATANELYSAILGKYVFSSDVGFGWTPGNLRVMLFDNNGHSIFNDFNKLKVKYPDLFKKNPFLKRLDTIFDQSSELSNTFTSRNSSFKDTMETDDVVYSWEDLLKHDDPKVNRLARHLFVYSFYTTGFNNKMNGYNNLIPPSMMKAQNIGDKTASMDAILKGLLQRFVDESSKEELADVIEDVLAHQIYEPNADFDASVSGFKVKDNNYYSIKTKFGRGFIGYNQNKIPIYKPYVKKTDKLYKLRGVVIGDEGNTPIYTADDRRGYRKNGKFVHQYGLDEYILKSNLEKDKIDTITEADKDVISKRFNGTFVEVNSNDLYFSKFQDMVDEVAEVDAIEEVVETSKEVTPVTPATLEKLDKLKEEGEPITLADFTNNSGGAIGADSKWDQIGSEFGMINNKHYYHGKKTPTGNVEISQNDAIEGQQKVTIAAREMGRIEPTHQVRDERLIRNWAQVKYSDAIFAIAEGFYNPGDEMNYGKKAKVTQVRGGTGYAVQMAINEGKPVFVYSQSSKLWYEYKNNTFSKMTDLPVLTKDFAGIGTRQINQ